MRRQVEIPFRAEVRDREVETGFRLLEELELSTKCFIKAALPALQTVLAEALEEREHAQVSVFQWAAAEALTPAHTELTRRGSKTRCEFRQQLYRCRWQRNTNASHVEAHAPLSTIFYRPSSSRWINLKMLLTLHPQIPIPNLRKTSSQTRFDVLKLTSPLKGAFNTTI